MYRLVRADKHGIPYFSGKWRRRCSFAAHRFASPTAELREAERWVVRACVIFDDVDLPLFRRAAPHTLCARRPAPGAEAGHRLRQSAGEAGCSVWGRPHDAFGSGSSTMGSVPGACGMPGRRAELFSRWVLGPGCQPVPARPLFAPLCAFAVPLAVVTAPDARHCAILCVRCVCVAQYEAQQLI